MILADLTRQRVDYQRLPNGLWRATVTVTLPEGVAHRYVAYSPGGGEVGAATWSGSDKSIARKFMAHNAPAATLSDAQLLVWWNGLGKQQRAAIRTFHFSGDDFGSKHPWAKSVALGVMSAIPGGGPYIHVAKSRPARCWRASGRRRLAGCDGNAQSKGCHVIGCSSSRSVGACKR